MPTLHNLLTRWLPLLIWMSLIFSGSSDVLSGEHTSRFFVPFMHWLSGNRLSPDQIDFLHILFRKSGHLTEYAILCILFWRATTGNFPAPAGAHSASARGRFLASVALSALYAASDEFHQSFIPTRTASFHDVVIDTVGAALGLAAYLLLRRLASRQPPASRLKPGELPGRS